MTETNPPTNVGKAYVAALPPDTRAELARSAQRLADTVNTRLGSTAAKAVLSGGATGLGSTTLRFAAQNSALAEAAKAWQGSITTKAILDAQSGFGLKSPSIIVQANALAGIHIIPSPAMKRSMESMLKTYTSSANGSTLSLLPKQYGQVAQAQQLVKALGLDQRYGDFLKAGLPVGLASTIASLSKGLLKDQWKMPAMSLAVTGTPARLSIFDSVARQVAKDLSNLTGLNAASAVMAAQFATQMNGTAFRQVLNQATAHGLYDGLSDAVGRGAHLGAGLRVGAAPVVQPVGVPATDPDPLGNDWLAALVARVASAMDLSARDIASDYFTAAVFVATVVAILTLLQHHPALRLVLGDYGLGAIPIATPVAKVARSAYVAVRDSRRD